MKMSNGQVHAQLVKFGKPPAKGVEKAEVAQKGAAPSCAPPAQGKGHDHSGY